ncbi:hypothetical protein CFIMG_004691RA [Ceratocystis fimbriata CBS 114723]|uniref:TOM core complex subunit Tom6 n=1 Tax=Ceratocystis fimbriata CBS 114723 TaxID=1035309 RepID=A0A2C5WZN4_9PEZI|nr:hypothetical protein CFIMG_004691RA [Ceratocystis fimbriata CBS 114723]
MAPRGITGPGYRVAPRGFFGSTYDALTSSENASVVRGVAIFGVAVTFFASGLGDLFVPSQ